jgi:cyclomaltodextrinase
MEPDWVRHALWWQVYPLGFTGAWPARDDGGDRPHRLRRLHAWLDYAVELGASGLALGPIFASETHGYDTVDHFRIDPRLGDDTDFDALIAAAHDRGLRVLLDGVFHHVGRGHPAFRAVLEQGPDAPTATWFRLTWPGPRHDTFEGHDGLVALNHREPLVADLVVEVMSHWLERGADGWRLDAAYAVPADFWAGVLGRVRPRHPDAWFVGEVIHGDYAEFVTSSTVNSVTQYELWKAVWSSLNEGNFYELDHALGRHNAFLDTFVPQTFLGNHDVTRLASRLTDQRHVGPALAVLLTLGGTPSIYAGDEQGFTGVKEDRENGDDAVRPPFPDDPTGLMPYGRPVHDLHQELIGLRRRHSWLHTARTRSVHLSNEAYAYEAAGDDRKLLVCLNSGDTTASVPVPHGRTVLSGAADVDQAGDAGAVARIGPHSFAVLDT